MATIEMAKNRGGAWQAVKGSLRAVATKAMRWTGYGGQSFGTTGSGGWYGSSWIRQLLPGAKYDYEAEAGRLWKNSAVAIGLDWLRKNFPEPRLVFERRKGDEWVEDLEAPVLQWLEEPNTNYDADSLWAATVLSLVVQGNAYWIREKNAMGREFFWYVPHWQMFPRWPNDGSEFISHYEYIVDGKRTRVETGNVIHFRFGLDPENERIGMSPLASCFREVCSDNEANSYTAAILRNVGVVGMIISPESATDEILPDDAKALKKLVKQQTTGESRGEPIVHTIPLRMAEFGATPEKLALDKIRKIPEARMLAAIGINGMVLGLSVGDTQRTFSNLKEANRHAYDNCLIPMQKTIAKQLAFALARPIKAGGTASMKPSRQERLRWDYTEVQSLSDDQNEAMKRAAMGYTSGVLKLNEARRRVGEKPETAPNGEAYIPNPKFSPVSDTTKIVENVA